MVSGNTSSICGSPAGAWDETDADEIFSRLIGDQVEPRREFIEQDALNVSSLDI